MPHFIFQQFEIFNLSRGSFIDTFFSSPCPPTPSIHLWKILKCTFLDEGLCISECFHLHLVSLDPHTSMKRRKVGAHLPKPRTWIQSLWHLGKCPVHCMMLRYWYYCNDPSVLSFLLTLPLCGLTILRLNCWIISLFGHQGTETCYYFNIFQRTRSVLVLCLVWIIVGCQFCISFITNVH